MAERRDPANGPITWSLLALVGGMFVTLLAGAWSLSGRLASMETGLAAFREEVREAFRRSDARMDALERRVEEGVKK